MIFLIGDSTSINIKSITDITLQCNYYGCMACSYAVEVLTSHYLSIK